MKIAAQLYTVREYTQTPEAFLETLKKIKEIGYESVQISGTYAMEADYIKKCLDETGLDLCATHTNRDRILKDTKAVIEEHKLWNCKYIGLGAYSKFWESPDMPLKEMADEFLKEFFPVAKEISDAGLTFLYHIHAQEFQHVEKGVTFLQYITERMPEKFGILADFYWTQVGGEDPYRFISQYKDKLQVVHFKDLLPKGNASAMAPVGEGNINYEAIYRELSKIGTEALAVEQDDCNGENPFDCLKRSLENIKKFAE